MNHPLFHFFQGFGDRLGEYDLVGWSISDLVMAQARCVCQGIFLRGGIDIGPFYFGDDVLISPALARAYEIETTVSAPVIALTESTMKWVMARKKKSFYAPGADPTPGYFKKLDKQLNGEELYFLDYAGVMLNEPNGAWPAEDRKAHQEAVEREDFELADKIAHECECNERDVGGAELIELRFLDDAISVEDERAIALDIQRRLFRRDLILRRVFEFQCHKFFR